MTTFTEVHRAEELADELSAMKLDYELLASKLKTALEDRLELARLLTDALMRMEECSNDCEGRTHIELSCGNCTAGIPVEHSFGCKAHAVLRRLMKGHT